MKYFRCEKCLWQFVATQAMTKEHMTCGAVVGCRVDENGDVIPVGCGGKIEEVSYESAMRG